MRLIWYETIQISMSTESTVATSCTTIRRRVRAWRLAAIALSVVVLAPLLVTEVPPIVDYPNHLARMVVLARAAGDPVLARIYGVHWNIIPNLAIDLLAPRLLWILPVHVVGRLLLAAALLVPVIGVIGYSRAVFRERLFWPLGSMMVADNLLFLLGFLNFLLSVGLALLVAAGWTRWRDRSPWRAGLLCGAGAVLVFFCHLCGLLFLLILTGSAEFERLVDYRKSGLSALVCMRKGAPILAMVIPPALLYSASPLATVAAPILYSSISWKLCELLAPVLGYNVALSLLVGSALLLFVGLCIAQGRWDAPLRSRIAMAILLLAFVVTPFASKGGAWIDVRFSIMAGFLLFAGFTPRRLPATVATPALVVFVMLILSSTGVIASNWLRSTTDLRELRSAIASVQPGTRVLVVTVTPVAHSAYWMGNAKRRRLLAATTEYHMAALLLIEHHAFWPLLFSTPSQQPVTVLPPYRDLAIGAGIPPDYRVLFIDRPSAADLRGAPYLAHWRDRFDEILVLDADGAPELAHPLPACLALVSDSGFAALLRIRHSTVPSGMVRAGPGAVASTSDLAASRH